MGTYLLKRLIYAFPILMGVNIITFALFFMLNTPDDMARVHLGEKYVQQKSIEQWKEQRGYDKPLFWNDKKTGMAQFTHTLFFQKSLRLFLLDFGISDSGRNISKDIQQRMQPSLAIAFPTFILGMFAEIAAAMLMVYFRATVIDIAGLIIGIALMSISSLFYVIAGQFFLSKWLHWFPISGFDTGIHSAKFLILPILIGIISGIGAGSRWYRTLFLEEIEKDYVKTARAKGLSERVILFKHVLKNAMLPILTGVVVVIPSLFMGSLILESFFGIPGLGSYVIDAIQSQDFAIVRSMVFLGSILYIIGLILTDFSYCLVDPRVRLR